MVYMRFVGFALKPHISQVWFPCVGCEIGMQEWLRNFMLK